MESDVGLFIVGILVFTKWYIATGRMVSGSFQPGRLELLHYFQHFEGIHVTTNIKLYVLNGNDFGYNYYFTVAYPGF